MDRHGDQAKEDEVLRTSERLATQHNLWVQRQEFKDQLNLFETRIDEQYEEVAHNFGQVNQDMILLREATDNLHDQVTANDANMERRMDSLERAINNLGRRHRHRSTSSSSSTSSHDDYSHDRHSSSSTDSRHGDHHRPRRPHARQEDSRSNSRRGEFHRHARPHERLQQEQALHQDRHQAARHAHHGHDDQPHDNVLHNMEPAPHRQAHVDAQDQGHQDPPRRDLRNHPRHDQRGRGQPQHDQDERAIIGQRQQPRQDLQQHHQREPSEASVHDVAPLANDPTSRPTSPPSGPMTRARAKALHDKVNSLLTTLDLDTPLDGMLPHAETLCVIRYVEHQDYGEGDTPWSREGEEQLIEKMYTELDPKSPEERKEEKTDGRSRTRSDRAADRATRLATGLPTGAIRTTSRGLGTSSGRRPVTDPVRTGPPGHRPGLTGSLTGRPVTDRSDRIPDRP